MRITMKTLRWLLALPAILAMVGCGSIPDVIVDAAKQSAKDQIEQKIDELLAEFGDQLDLSMFLPGGLDLGAQNDEQEDDPGRGTTR
jgi:hypothetical protein